jgi:4,5:9,10-diseco-3-hydroxy-5,9,17-trioxoandrosta-1(10),2-diene-4-oate hydrolase
MSTPDGAWRETIHGWKLHFHDLGEGPPVVFLHGSGPGASGWSNFADNAHYLTARGYRCVLVDSLGYGLSDKPTDTAYTLPVMSGALVGLLDALGIERFTLVGNSQGGAIAIRTALDHPERAERMILMAPGGLEPRETYMEMRGIRSMLRCIYGPEGITAAGMRKVFEKQLYDSALVTDALVEDRTAVALTQPIEVFRTMKVDNQADRLGELQCPVLGLWGVDDLFCPVSGAATLAARVRDCRVVTLSRCGHWVMVEHADVFNRLVVDFLDHG